MIGLLEKGKEKKRRSNSQGRNKDSLIIAYTSILIMALLEVNLWREQLKSSGGKMPGIAQSSGAVLGQVLLA